MAVAKHRRAYVTPATKLLESKNLEYQLHAYQSKGGQSNVQSSYGLEAANSLGISAERIFKTLLVTIDGDVKHPVVGIVPAAHSLDLKKLAKHVNGRKASMADPQVAQRITGYVIGGISPLGQKQLLRTYIDTSILTHRTVYVSAGKRGLQLELDPKDLILACGADVADIAKYEP